MKIPLFFGEPVHQETLEPEENDHLVSGIKITKVLSFNHPLQKENNTMLYFIGSPTHNRFKTKHRHL